MTDTVAFDSRDAVKDPPPKARKKTQSAVLKQVAGNGQRCTAPKCGRPIEQNTKVQISPNDRDDVRHARCAPKVWEK